jgi:hypothetical protein
MLAGLPSLMVNAIIRFFGQQSLLNQDDILANTALNIIAVTLSLPKEHSSREELIQNFLAKGQLIDFVMDTCFKKSQLTESGILILTKLAQNFP